MSIAASFGAEGAKACPGALFGLEVTPPITGPRRGVRLFVLDAKGSPAGVQESPVQVDPVDDDGHLKFFDDDKFRDAEVARTDYLTFRLETFGKRMDVKKDKLPCRGAQVWELYDQLRGRYAYMTNCGAPTAPLPLFKPSVTFEQSEHRLESETYRYRFNKSNYMQFDEIAFRGPDGKLETVAKDSKLMIRADVKKFFTMHFDSDEIESELQASRLGPVGNLARLSFFLKILIFKIRMSLATDVGFFADSGHIPMMVNLPVNSYEYLHPKSGILYSWALGDAAAKAPRTLTMPILDPAEVAKGFAHLGTLGTKFCKGRYCTFKYTVDVGGRRLSMDLGLERPLVEKGFYPIFVEDLGAAREAMGWDMDADEAKGRMGMYFEVSGLPKGGHPWDFWMRLGAPSESQRVCPGWVRVSAVP